MNVITGTNIISLKARLISSMARIGEFHCKDSFLVCVYSGEGNIPHFHVIDIQNNRESCVRIDCAEYFLHGDKTFTFNSKQKKELCNFLNTVSPYEEDDGKTYYRIIWEEWNRNNPEYRIKKPDSIPDYTQLES